MYIQLACGLLGWSPSDFWQSTFYEFSNTYVGWLKTNRQGPWSEENSGIGDPWTEEEIKETTRKHNLQQLLRPDGALTKEQKRKLKEARLCQ